MKQEDLKDGMDVWTIRASNLRVPRGIYVIGGTLRHVKDKWHDYWRMDPWGYDFKPNELFASPEEAEDALIRFLDRMKENILFLRKARGESEVEKCDL